MAQVSKQTEPPRSTSVTTDDRRQSVQSFLERYGRALSFGDARVIRECWEVPALVVADEGSRAVSSLEEVVSFFAQAKAQYEAQGLRETRPTLVRLDSATAHLLLAQVRWPAYDAQGVERAVENTLYTLRAYPDGSFKICVVLVQETQGPGARPS